MLVAIGASSDLPLSCEVLNYEAPFGVGYLVAQLTHQAGLEQSEARKDIPIRRHWRARLLKHSFVPEKFWILATSAQDFWPHARLALFHLKP